MSSSRIGPDAFALIVVVSSIVLRHSMTLESGYALQTTYARGTSSYRDAPGLNITVSSVAEITWSYASSVK